MLCCCLAVVQITLERESRVVLGDSVSAERKTQEARFTGCTGRLAHKKNNETKEKAGGGLCTFTDICSTILYTNTQFICNLPVTFINIIC